MPFVKFTEKGRSFAAKASVSKTGMISFNDGARRLFSMDEYNFCVLYYDKETQRIGVQLTNDKDAEGARKLRLRSTGADIAGKSFIDYFQIPLRGTTICEIFYSDTEEMLIIDLKRGKIRNKKQIPGKATNDEEN